MAAEISIKTAAAKGAFAIGGAQAVRAVTSVISTIIVAHIISPGDYGVIAMVAPFSAFIVMFQDLGLSSATIQAKQLGHHQSNALFWINVSASVAISLTMILISPFVAWFYSDSRAGYIAAASGLTVLVSGSAIQHIALFNRDLRFALVARIDIASALAAFSATVAAALLLRNYWALWLGSLAGAAVTSTLVWTASSWRPSLPISFRGSRDLIRFGGSLTGFNLMNFFSRNADNILIGKLWGASTLGLYDRSYRLMMYPIQSINAPLGRVMIPVLSRLQDDAIQYRRLYLTCLRAITMLTFPALAVAAATSDRLVPFLLGDNWADAAPIFFWLSLAAFFQPVGNTTGWLYISHGRGREMMWVGGLSAIVTIAAFGIGALWGVTGVAAAYFFSTGLRMPFIIGWATRGTAIKAMDVYLLCLPSIVSAGIAWLIVRALSQHLPIALLVALTLALSYFLNVVANSFTPGGRDTIRGVFTATCNWFRSWRAL